jgi:hypothetical protein
VLSTTPYQFIVFLFLLCWFLLRIIISQNSVIVFHRVFSPITAFSLLGRVVLPA